MCERSYGGKKEKRSHGSWGPNVGPWGEACNASIYKGFPEPGAGGGGGGCV